MLIFPFGIKILGDQLKMTRQRALNPVRTITFMMTIFWVYPLSSCRKHVAYDDNPLMTIPAASQRKTTGTNPQSQAALPVQKIDGSLLLTTIKSAEEYKLGGHTGVTINIDRGVMNRIFISFIFVKQKRRNAVQNLRLRESLFLPVTSSTTLRPGLLRSLYGPVSGPKRPLIPTSFVENLP